MKIAILSTPYIAVPPVGYGGIELVVHNLTEKLVEKGHQVLLFATGDSLTKAKLAYYYPKAVGNNLEVKNNSLIIVPHLHAFFKLIEKEDIDIIHNNCQYEAMFFCDLQKKPFIHTLHGAFYKNLKSPSGLNELKRKILKMFKHHPFISISNNQRIGLPDLNYIKTIYNGINIEKFHLGDGKGNYLAYLGRITPNKGVEVAIKIAKKLNIPLKIAAFVDKGDMDYFKNIILPQVNKNIEFLGEIKSEKEKSEFFGRAKAFIFPIQWHEPFGLVMIEAMACGTPVIAFNKGSVPEVVVNNKTGFIVESEEEMIEAIKKIDSIDRQECRKHVEKNFTVEKMVNDYLEAYKIVINNFKN